MTIIISIMMMMMISLLVDDERRKLLNFFEKRQTQFRFLSIGAISGTEETLEKKVDSISSEKNFTFHKVEWERGKITTFRPQKSWIFMHILDCHRPTNPHGQICLGIKLFDGVDCFDHLQTKSHAAVSVVRPEMITRT